MVIHLILLLAGVSLVSCSSLTQDLLLFQCISENTARTKCRKPNLDYVFGDGENACFKCNFFDIIMSKGPYYVTHLKLHLKYWPEVFAKELLNCPQCDNDETYAEWTRYADIIAMDIENRIRHVYEPTEANFCRDSVVERVVNHVKNHSQDNIQPLSFDLFITANKPITDYLKDYFQILNKPNCHPCVNVEESARVEDWFECGNESTDYESAVDVESVADCHGLYSLDVDLEPSIANSENISQSDHQEADDGGKARCIELINELLAFIEKNAEPSRMAIKTSIRTATQAISQNLPKTCNPTKKHCSRQKTQEKT